MIFSNIQHIFNVKQLVFGHLRCNKLNFDSNRIRKYGWKIKFINTCNSSKWFVNINDMFIIQFEGGLYATALVIDAAYKLSETAKKAPTIPEVCKITLENWLYSWQVKQINFLKYPLVFHCPRFELYYYTVMFWWKHLSGFMVMWSHWMREIVSKNPGLIKWT